MRLWRLLSEGLISTTYSQVGHGKKGPTVVDGLWSFHPEHSTLHFTRLTEPVHLTEH